MRTFLVLAIFGLLLCVSAVRKRASRAGKGGKRAGKGGKRAGKGGKRAGKGGKRGGKKSADQAASLPEAVLFPGQIEIKRPAFLYIDEDTDELLVSQFGVTSSWNPLPATSTITRMSMAGIKAALNNSEGLQAKTGDQKVWIGKGLEWPNILIKTPPEIGDYIVIPDGFLPPGKANGGIFLAKPDGELFRISPYVRGAFYHEVEFHDMNGDGLLDMIAPRTVKKLFSFKGELLWFENPGEDKVFTEEWKPHRIVAGPDVVIRSKHYGDELAIYATEFFAKVPRITINFVNTQTGELTSQKVIDDNLGKPFGIEFADIDGDGKEDLVATNHQNDEDEVKASVYAYEIPDDIKTGDFKRHTLVEWPSKLKTKMPGAGAPGFPIIFYPKVNQKKGPMHIVVAGDGSFDIWYLRPTGKPFEYDTQILPIGGTTGQLLLGDFSGDGIHDVLITDNDNWKIQALTFKNV